MEHEETGAHGGNKKLTDIFLRSVEVQWIDQYRKTCLRTPEQSAFMHDPKIWSTPLHSHLNDYMEDRL